jgi:hypothetical protein
MPLELAGLSACLRCDRDVFARAFEISRDGRRAKPVCIPPEGAGITRVFALPDFFITNTEFKIYLPWILNSQLW